MKAPKHIQQLIDDLGADIEIWADSPDSWTIEATAPDGHVWVESGATVLISRFFKLWPETKAEAFNDIEERIKQGIEIE